MGGWHLLKMGPTSIVYFPQKYVLKLEIMVNFHGIGIELNWCQGEFMQKKKAQYKNFTVVVFLHPAPAIVRICRPTMCVDSLTIDSQKIIAIIFF